MKIISIAEIDTMLKVAKEIDALRKEHEYNLIENINNQLFAAASAREELPIRLGFNSFKALNVAKKLLSEEGYLVVAVTAGEDYEYDLFVDWETS